MAERWDQGDHHEAVSEPKGEIRGRRREEKKIDSVSRQKEETRPPSTAPSIIMSEGLEKQGGNEEHERIQEGAAFKSTTRETYSLFSNKTGKIRKQFRSPYSYEEHSINRGRDTTREKGGKINARE